MDLVRSRRERNLRPSLQRELFALVRGCYKTQFRRLSKGTIALGNTLRILELCVPSPGLSGVMERLRQFDRAEHVCNALEVVCHRREADFNPCTGQSAHQQTWMSEDPVLDRCERMLDSGAPYWATRDRRLRG